MLSITILLIGFALLGFINLTAGNSSVALTSVIIVFFFIGFAADVSRNRRHRIISSQLIVGLLFRIFLLFFDIYGRNIYHLPQSGQDTEMFYRGAILMARGYLGYGGNFSAMMSWFARWVGDNRLFLQFILVLFSIVSILYVDKSLIHLGISERNRKRIAWLMCLLPNYACISSIFLRESTVAMFILIGLYFFVIWWTGGSEISFWIGAASCMCGSLFHSGASSVAVGMMAARVLSNRRRQTIQFKLKSVLPLIVFLFLFAYLFNNHTDEVFDKMQGVETIEDIANTHNDGGSSYGAYVGNSSNPVSLVVFTPIRMIMFQFSPFFWQIRGLNDIIAMVFDSFFYMYVFFSTIPYLRRKHLPYRTTILLFLVMGLAAAFVFGWGVTNTGNALKHRNKMIAIYMIQLGLILESKTIIRGYQNITVKEI